VANNGNVKVDDSLFIGKIEYDTLTDSVLMLGRSGTVGWMSFNDAGGSITRAYADMYIDSLGSAVGNGAWQEGLLVNLPNDSPEGWGNNWVDMTWAKPGEYAGLPYADVRCGTSSTVDSIVIGPKGALLYQMNVSISFAGASGSNLGLGIYKNGTLMRRFVLFSAVASAGERKSAALSGIMRLLAGDVLTLKLKNVQGIAKTIYIYNFDMQLTRVGD
jgi:hypothetical protein